MKRSKMAISATAAMFWLFFGAACTEDKIEIRCRNIPVGGCPVNPNACMDPMCNAVYACSSDGAWTLRETCPPHDFDAATSPVKKDASSMDGGLGDVTGASGGPGCADLQAPDCALAVAGACPSGCCGCEDLFVCANHGWNVWGTCTDGGLAPR